MHACTAVIEHCPDTKLYVGYVPGFAGAHSQGATLDQLHANLREAAELYLEEFPLGPVGQPLVTTFQVAEHA